jgi:D-glycero-beta-D-manno-heptose-7-phosphate kinase
MKKILVIGDSCIDKFIYGKADRLCPEAPVPVFIPNKTTCNGGMAQNVFENIQSIYKDVDIITTTKQTIKTRYVEEKTNHQIIRIDSETTPTDRIKDIKKIDFSKYGVVVISDYNKGFLSTDDIEYICNSHNNVLIDTKKILGDYCANAKFIKINEIELQNNISAYVNIDDFKNSLIVTLGGKGCKYKETIYPVSKVVVKDLSGAGDTFMAALAVNYIKTKNIDKSIRFANECATKVVQLKGVNTIK